MPKSTGASVVDNMLASEELLKDASMCILFSLYLLIVTVNSQFVLKVPLNTDSEYRIKMNICLIVLNGTKIL